MCSNLCPLLFPRSDHPRSLSVPRMFPSLWELLRLICVSSWIFPFSCLPFRCRVFFSVSPFLDESLGLTDLVFWNFLRIFFFFLSTLGLHVLVIYFSVETFMHANARLPSPLGGHHDGHLGVFVASTSELRTLVCLEIMNSGTDRRGERRSLVLSRKLSGSHEFSTFSSLHSHRSR